MYKLRRGAYWEILLPSGTFYTDVRNETLESWPIATHKSFHSFPVNWFDGKIPEFSEDRCMAYVRPTGPRINMFGSEGFSSARWNKLI